MAGACARALRRRLRATAALPSGGDEALRRLKLDAGHIEACLRQACAERSHPVPAGRGSARILWFARTLAAGGEVRITKEQLLKETAAFDGAQALEMAELQLLPAALRVALCEALCSLAGEVLQNVRARRLAENWVRRAGRGRIPSRQTEAFLEYALQLAAELEKPELHAKVEWIIGRRGDRIERLVERVHRASADRCLRLDNLMRIRHMLGALDWEKCFEELSAADVELREDPADVYARMDAPSRSMVREAVAEVSAATGQQELTVVRCALRTAREAARNNGDHDPRATVCWYLLEDEGRRELCHGMGCRRRLRRRIPDAEGRYTVALAALNTALVLALLLAAVGNPFLMIYPLPAAWVLSMRLIGRFYPRSLKPHILPRMELECIPDSARTLVVLPVLLSSAKRAREMIAHMEALGCLERDENIDYLLLGDFRDGDGPHLPGDEDILAAAREGVERLNASAGRTKYFYLHRERTLRQRDNRWMGENRKRGALMALNRLLLMREGADLAFSAEGRAAIGLAGRYRYVVTLDADTEYLPGTLHRLIGAMRHPLNRAYVLGGRRRGYAVLQPNMQLMAEADVNAYVHLTAGAGGVDSYPVSVSEFYQDMTGRGCFAGKGIYDVRAFTEATEGVLRDDEILSHDLIEGILCGAGFLGDVSFYDGCPETLDADLTRLHRWTRGDWQLLPVLFSRLRLRAVDRMKLAGNLLRSLYAPALAGLLIHSVWIDAPGTFALALLLAFQEPLLGLPRSDGRAWKAALLKLAVLPAEAACMLDAILRTLWRLAVSRKHLMEWVPAADARSGGSMAHVSGKVAALLLLPGLLRPFWIPAVVALAALFFVGAGWADDLSRTPTDGRSVLDEEQTALLGDIARRTWRFFEDFVPVDGCGLPPDNVQLDPPVGPAMRTSPTNIGLYLMSCLASRELGFIGEKEMYARMSRSVASMERMEKWNGQLYNWYDTGNLQPLRPRYVSAVDSGNLAGALLLCAHALKDDNEGISRRMRALAEGMDLSALYDGERKLFFIGMDVENGRMSESHYDLYASEARILSYAAMMLGQVDTEHWKHLSRAGVRLGRRQALISWSGTMFEYMMPELLLRSHANTLAGQSRRGVLACQMDYGRELNRPWGVSESGYYAFDMHLNYQYRAFGLRALALNGSAIQDVVTPYAAALALAENPAAAAANLRRMCEMGWGGEYGMYEAADYLRLDAGRRPRVVRSHMAHHQGMALCALCNALRGDVLSHLFMEIPEARYLHLLLQEKSGARIHVRRHGEVVQPRPAQDRTLADFARSGRRENCAADTHLLHGASTAALVTARGGAFVWSEGLQLNRFSGDLQNRHEGMYVHLEDANTGEKMLVGSSGRVVFDVGSACFREDFSSLRAELRIVASPEDGTLYQSLEIENTAEEERSLSVTGCLAVALAPEKDMRAHPVFQNLFVESACENGRALTFKRRQRDGGEPLPLLLYAASGAGEAEYETDFEKLAGRTGALGLPGGIAGDFTGSAGCVLNPCAALRLRLRLGSGETARLHFALALAAPGDSERRIAEISKHGAPERALQLASTQTRAVLGHAGVDAQRFRLFQRVSAVFFDAKLRTALLESGEACAPAPRELLWQAGISGDLPILLVEYGEEGRLDCIREALRMHAFYRMMGVKLDFVLIDGHGSDYRQPSRGTIGDLIASSHLNGQFNAPGGAFVLEKQNIGEEVHAAIARAAALRLDACEDIQPQLRAALDGLRLRRAEIEPPMPAVEARLPEDLQFFNGYGGFDDGGYVMRIGRDLLPPAPWSNVLASEQAGAVVTERGGGFAWFANSRSGRLTPFANDPLREGWGWMFYLMDEGEGGWTRLLPGDLPMTEFIVRHAPGVSSWSARAGEIAFEVRMRAEGCGVRFDLLVKNEGGATKHLRLAGFVDWLMGTDVGDANLTRTWSRFGACFASGAAEGVGCFIADDPQARAGCDRQSFFAGGDAMQPRGLKQLDTPQGGWTLQLPMNLRSGELRRCRFLLGCGRDVPSAYALAREFRSGEALRRSSEDWQARLDKLRIETPDPAVNLLANGFLQAQVLNGRIRARTGLYQPGGAFGFRDQMQDMLPMIHYEPERVRRHLLHCAARQFEAGDVLHWWHEPYSGVRTRISDDLLFLPYVTAQYVRITQDEAVLWDSVPFLADVEIPEGTEDVYASMHPTSHCATLHEHCMRAFRRAAQTGEHGLCLMGTGDWNDGMNRVGDGGRGESVWLSQFLAACAADYAPIAPREEDRAWLMALRERLLAAVEAHGWDGRWYLRAYTDEGEKIGSRESPCCSIDAISQSWAVLAGLDAQRCGSAMDAAWETLADEELKLIRLLTPPFSGEGSDPGYIAAYPEGIRENGAQYTHAACWMLCALAELGDGERAHRALQMLLPVNHARSREEVEVYRVEPYVMAADVYTNPQHPGRGGWTWYTGSAGWMLAAILRMLGYERRGNRVRMNALLGDWPEAGVRIHFGLSSYHLVCRRDAACVELDDEMTQDDWILLADDGREHKAVFPPRMHTKR